MNIKGSEQTLTLKRTDIDDADFLHLVKLLDADLLGRYGEQQAFFDQFNTLSAIKNVVIAYVDGMAAGCGAFKEFETGVAEIKRMYVEPLCRGRGIAGCILHELERWASELEYQYAILETAKKQPEAISCYLKGGYLVTENFGDYIGVEASVCMRKAL